jgi:hypothetical protein
VADRAFTRDPETGDVYEVDPSEVDFNLSIGHELVDQPQQSQISDDFSGIGGALKAAGIGAIRGAAPFVGSGIVSDLTGYTEEGQRQIFEEQPVASIVGEAGAVVAGVAALKGAGAINALKGIGAFGRLAKAAESGSTLAKLGQGVASGAAYGLAGADTSRILRGEKETTARGLAGDIMTGAAVGAGISMLGALGGKASRFLSKGKAAAGVSEKEALASLANPIERKQAQSVIDGIRSAARTNYRPTAATLADDTNRAVSELVYRRGVSALPPKLAAAAKGVVAQELEKKAAMSGMAHVAREIVSVRSMGKAGIAGIAASAVPPLAPLIYGVGAVGIIRSAVKGIQGPIGAQASKIAYRALNPMLGVGQKASAIRPAIRPLSDKSAEYVTNDNYSEIRYMIDTAPTPEERIDDLLIHGLPETEAANIAAHQQIVLDMLDRSLPRVSAPRPETIAKANRVIDSVVNPAGVIKRMSELSMTVEDRNTMEALDPDTMAEIRSLIRTERARGMSFGPAERRQQDLILGQAIGIRPESIQSSIGKQSQPTKGVKPPNLADNSATTLQSLEN